MEQWSRLVDTLHELTAWTVARSEAVRGDLTLGSDLSFVQHQLVAIRASFSSRQ